jgi:hypothetical protein
MGAVRWSVIGFRADGVKPVAGWWVGSKSSLNKQEVRVILRTVQQLLSIRSSAIGSRLSAPRAWVQ